MGRSGRVGGIRIIRLVGGLIGRRWLGFARARVLGRLPVFGRRLPVLLVLWIGLVVGGWLGRSSPLALVFRLRLQFVGWLVGGWLGHSQSIRFVQLWSGDF